MNQASNHGATPLYIASREGHTEVVATLIAANAEVDLKVAANAERWKGDDEGFTPLILASQNGHAEIVAKLLAANADVNLPGKNSIVTPMVIACNRGHLAVVQLLSAYGARRGIHATPMFVFYGPGDYHDLVAWLAKSHHWTALHHLEFLTAERALALLRAGADLHAAAQPCAVPTRADLLAQVQVVNCDTYVVPGAATVTPLSLAQDLAAAGLAAEGTAAFLVLEAAKPWSRKTHKYFPAPARERAAELLRVGQWFKRLPSDFPIPFELWENFVVPHAVTRDSKPPAPQ